MATYTPDRHTDAYFSDAEATAFGNGEEVPVRSSHVTSARMDWDANTLYLTFDSGAVYAYPCDHVTARGFAVAPSKGGWLWDWFLHRGQKGTRV